MKRIAILTTFQDFHPRYSLTGIVKDQVTMLTKHGHDVTLYVCENFNFDNTEFIDRENLKNLIPFAHLKDYRKR